MANVKLPNRIYGNWIWKKSLLNLPDSFLLMRREFVCPSVGLETNLWSSANSAYQLFINGRLVGFGPRAHQSCGTSYIDQHELTFYLEAGINVIAVQVYYNSELAAPNRRTPGLWCQMESSRQEILCSDDSWHILEGECFCGPRARISAEQGLTQFFRSSMCPRKWTHQMYMPDHSWTRPDHIVPVGEFGSRLELHPLAPAAISDEHPLFEPVERGRIIAPPNWTQVRFRDCSGKWRETFAAGSYLFCEEAQELPVRIFTDDPFKFFCNNNLVCSGSHRDGSEGDVLPLRAGWNRLVLVQEPGRHSMGFLLIFPGELDDDTIRIYQDMVENAPAAWNMAGPLKMTLEEATPSLHFERLQVQSYFPTMGDLTDPADILANCLMQPEDSPVLNQPLQTGDYLIYRLDIVRYGFVRFYFDASEDDIIDITVGLRRTASGGVSAGDGIRGTGTLIHRGGKTTYLTFIPADCLYVMVSIRRAAGHVLVESVSFEELVRHERHESLFRCSDELLNRFWETGRQTLRRSAAFVPLSESRADYDCYMLDAYIDAANMASAFGDFDYMAARLRQFSDAQLENGEIPALTYGVRHASQIHHLFFYPVWMNYNYRFSANLVELERAVPNLDLLREYFEALLDESTGLLVDVESRFALQSRLSYGDFQPGETPTYLNALFCRFLLSAAEIYRVVNQPLVAARCVKLAQKVAEALRERNFDPEKKLFARWNLDSPRHPDDNLFANFCAVFGGVLPLEAFEHFFFSFFNFDPPFDRSEESHHPYFHFLFLEMMFALGQRDWAFRYFRDYWERRLCGDSGAWRASLDSLDPAPTKFSDGSCVSPNIFLLREVVGIRIAEAGHTVIYFSPALNQVDWAEAVIPMARGRLKVKWEKLTDGSLDVTLDANIQVKILPEMTHSQLRNTTFRLGEKVTLLDPPADLVDDVEEPAE